MTWHLDMFRDQDDSLWEKRRSDEDFGRLRRLKTDYRSCLWPGEGTWIFLPRSGGGHLAISWQLLYDMSRWCHIEERRRRKLAHGVTFDSHFCHQSENDQLETTWESYRRRIEDKVRKRISPRVCLSEIVYDDRINWPLQLENLPELQRVFVTKLELFIYFYYNYLISILLQ